MLTDHIKLIQHLVWLQGSSSPKGASCPIQSSSSGNWFLESNFCHKSLFWLLNNTCSELHPKHCLPRIIASGWTGVPPFCSLFQVLWNFHLFFILGVMQHCRLWCQSTLFSYISKEVWKAMQLLRFWSKWWVHALCSDLCILFFRFTKENIHLGCQLIHLSHLGIKLRRDTDGTCYQANKPTCIWWHWLDIAALKNKWGKRQTGPRCCKLK